MTDFSIRNRETELMDNPELSKNLLEKILLDVDRANRLLNGDRLSIFAVRQLIREFPQESYTIVDMGCGNGHILRRVVQMGRSTGIKINAIGIDLNEKALNIARTASLDFPEIRYLKQDILDLRPDDLKCDILLCTLTMHHFHNEDVPNFLQQFAKLARIGVVINDLQRSRSAYYLFKAFSAIFIRTDIAKHDGLISIQSGFTRTELEGFAQNLPSLRHEISWKWAFRYVWLMRTKATSGINRVYE